jgi:GNAT superfamily N-acetyltransferase
MDAQGGEVSGDLAPELRVPDLVFDLDPAALPLDTQHLVATHVSRALQGEACILTARNTPDALLGQIQDHPTLVLWNGQTPIGFATFWKVGMDRDCDLYELGSVWLAPAYRGREHSHRLYRKIMELRRVLFVRNRTAVAFSITTNPRAISLGREVGFIELDGLGEWFGILPLQVTCGPCDLVAEADKAGCEKRRVTCRLRIIPPPGCHGCSR